MACNERHELVDVKLFENHRLTFSFVFSAAVLTLIPMPILADITPVMKNIQVHDCASLDDCKIAFNSV